MKRTREDAFAFGGSAERLVKRMLQSEHRLVLDAGALGLDAKPGTGGAPGLVGEKEFVITPDLIAAARGKSEFFEVKAKTSSILRRTSGFLETGLAERPLNAYRAFQGHTGMKGFIVFVHQQEREVLTAPVDRFGLARVARDHGTIAAYGEPMVFVRCVDLDLWMTFDEIDQRIPFGTSKLTADRIVHYAALSDLAMGVDPEEPRDISDEKMLEEIQRRGARLDNGIVSTLPGKNEYRFRRSFYYWLKTSDAGKVWASAQDARGTRVEHPADPSKFQRIEAELLAGLPDDLRAKVVAKKVELGIALAEARQRPCVSEAAE